MQKFGQFYLDKEKDIIVELYSKDAQLSYILRTPYHKTGNLITNLASLCNLPISFDESGLKVIRGEIPCYIDGDNREVYVFRLNDTKVANIYPDGEIERKAYVPAIAKTLMSQTKDYHLDFRKTLVKTYIRREPAYAYECEPGCGYPHSAGHPSSDPLPAVLYKEARAHSQSGSADQAGRGAEGGGEAL